MTRDYDIEIEKRTHHFIVRSFTRQCDYLLTDFSKKFIHWGWERKQGRYRKVPQKVFAASNEKRTHYRFHINCYDEFIHFFNDNHIPVKRMLIKDAPLYNPDLVELPVKQGWSPRDYQEPVIDYITEVNPKYRQKLVVLYTGAGKSYCAMEAISRMQSRFVLVARPTFLDKWVLDIEKTFDIPKEDILLVRGSRALMDVLTRGKEGTLTEKVILISNKTLGVYLKNYERFGDELYKMGYDVLPDQLYEALGAKVRLIDEVHLDYHNNFKLDLYTHVPMSVSLTATFITDDPFIKKMHDLAYLPESRYNGARYDPYINSIALMYQFKFPKKIRDHEWGSKNYSHHAVERSIMKNKYLLENYLNMIYKMIDQYYLLNKDKKDGDKFIVFCSSVKMCTIVTEYLQKKLPGLTINRYVQDDPYENLINSDGMVSTLLSAGTGVDIDQLFLTVLTTAVDSSPSNIQGFGRLRKMKDGRNPVFVYFTNLDNKKHLRYHNRKKELITPKSLNFKEVNYSKLI